MTYLDALQRALASEHAAVYIMGALGAQTSQSASPSLYDELESAYTSHRARRDLLTSKVRDVGADPVAAQPAYRLPTDLFSSAVVMRRALHLERGIAAAYAYLVANSPRPERRWAIAALTEAAVRALAFRGTPETFPGSAEHADR